MRVAQKKIKATGAQPTGWRWRCPPAANEWPSQSNHDTCLPCLGLFGSVRACDRRGPKGRETKRMDPADCSSSDFLLTSAMRPGTTGIQTILTSSTSGQFWCRHLPHHSMSMLALAGVCGARHERAHVRVLLTCCVHYLRFAVLTHTHTRSHTHLPTAHPVTHILLFMFDLFLYV